MVSCRAEERHRLKNSWDPLSLVGHVPSPEKSRLVFLHLDFSCNLTSMLSPDSLSG